MHHYTKCGKIVENINQNSIKQVENNEFESDDENDLVNCNSTSTNIGLHEAIDQTIKIRDLVCKCDDTSEIHFRYLDGLEDFLTKKRFCLGVKKQICLYQRVFVFTKISKRLLVKL
ncbi:hypothetical protein HZS_6340 [Henneguya salminicola]|nr:hypothetical protein HZS_6340 [Henneguya salminicola]